MLPIDAMQTSVVELHAVLLQLAAGLDWPESL